MIVLDLTLVLQSVHSECLDACSQNGVGPIGVCWSFFNNFPTQCAWGLQAWGQHGQTIPELQLQVCQDMCPAYLALTSLQQKPGGVASEGSPLYQLSVYSLCAQAISGLPLSVPRAGNSLK